MEPKTRKRRRVSRTQLNITWKKGEDEEKGRFERAVELTGGSANAVVRALMKEWTDIVLAKSESEIRMAAKRVSK